MTPEQFTANLAAAHTAALAEDVERTKQRMLWERYPRAQDSHWPHGHLSQWNFYMDCEPSEGANYGLRSEFHVRGGLTAARLKCGCIALSSWLPEWREASSERIWRREVIAILLPTEWDSVVCAVSKQGETRERWDAMLAFHGVGEAP